MLQLIFLIFLLTVQWAEVIGARLDEMIAAEKLTFDQVNNGLSDGEKQKELLSQDEEEDFLDEGKSAKCGCFLTTNSCRIIPTKKSFSDTSLQNCIIGICLPGVIFGLSHLSLSINFLIVFV